MIQRIRNRSECNSLSNAFAYYHSTVIPTTIEETPVDVIAEDSLEESFIAEELTDTINC